jgi:hypothetical protein
MDDLIMELKARVGDMDYARFRALCRETAAECGARLKVDVASDTSVTAWQFAEVLEFLVDEDKLWRAFLHIYMDAPCYSWLSMADSHIMSEHERAEYAVWLQDRLSGEDDALAGPVTYTLWCDHFEDPNRCAPMWSFLTAQDLSQTALQRLLPVIGPVPYEMKRDFLWKHASNAALHPFIFQALRGSEFDIHGKLHAPEDRADARKLLAGLQVSDAAAVKQLQESLEQPEHYWVRNA